MPENLLDRIRTVDGKTRATIACGCGCSLIVLMALLCLVGSLTASPRVPVIVTIRDSMVGQGKVAIFSNQSSSRLTVSVECENQRVGDKRSFNIDLEPNGTFEVGWLEGWTFVSGETITISHPDYRSSTYFVP